MSKAHAHNMPERNAAPAVANPGSLTAYAVGESQYLPEWSESDPNGPNPFWTSGYAMEIANGTTRPFRIERRHWDIEANGSDARQCSISGSEPEQTDGAGIGGKVRVLHPGETFLYWSATPLSKPDGGYMSGHFSGHYEDGAGEPDIIPVERFALAGAEGKPVQRDHDEDAAHAQRRQLNLTLNGYIRKVAQDGFAVLDAEDLPVAWQWEFKRFCIAGGNFNKHKYSGVSALVLKSEFDIIVAIDSDLIHTDRAIYTEHGGFENLRLILTYRNPGQDWQLGGNVNEAILKLLETSDVPRHAWDKVSAEIAYVLKVAIDTDGKATAIRPPSKRPVSDLAESSLEKRRERERKNKAAYRQRLRLKAAPSPHP